ncbi:hypothetical protein LOZ80_34815 [Paenibacillus sp. HWE-109]|uniref:hypothetical protein n=1 Tax=Paenibacillus sp. HWE-109 TaxID=1306526 RepID=UPI001EE0360E|nr:hypothetical protein [Paenibacillus sp. HWE-109]UKS26630.1 hypothetical protein LOZ80_34815 [Paenibacillus sp. HWE-109]
MILNRRVRFTSLFAIIVVLTGVLALLIFGLTLHRAETRAKDGVLDLRDWSLNQDGPLRLNGIWSFRWERELTKDATVTKSASLAEVPGVWTRYGIPGRGFATYHLRVLTQGNIGSLGKLHSLPRLA